LRCKTPRKVTGHGRGGGKSEWIKAVQKEPFNTIPLLIADEIGGVPVGLRDTAGERAKMQFKKTNAFVVIRLSSFIIFVEYRRRFGIVKPKM